MPKTIAVAERPMVVPDFLKDVRAIEVDQPISEPEVVTATPERTEERQPQREVRTYD